MRTQEQTKTSREQLLNQLEDIIENTRAENLKLLKEIGRLNSAESTTFKVRVDQIESNNHIIGRHLAQFQILKNELLWV